MSAPISIAPPPAASAQAQQPQPAPPQQQQPSVGQVAAVAPAAAAPALPSQQAAAAAAAAAGLPPPGPTASAAATTPPAAAAASDKDARFEKCGFAKLLGDNGLEYYIKKYEITLGRKSKASNLDVVLGDSPVLSRQHARIIYAFSAKRWELHVEGKNGITVNGALYTPATGPCVLNSQDLLQAGDHNFYFLLPKQQRKRAPKGSKAATPAASEGTAATQQQQGLAGVGVQQHGLSLAQQQQQQPVPSPRLGGLLGQQQQQQQQQQTPAAAAAGLGPALDGPQLGGISPVLPPPTAVPGFSPIPADPLNLQPHSSGPLLPGVTPNITPFGNGTGGLSGAGMNGDLLQPQAGWGSGFGMEAGFSGGLGDLGQDPDGPAEMED